MTSGEATELIKIFKNSPTNNTIKKVKRRPTEWEQILIKLYPEGKKEVTPFLMCDTSQASTLPFPLLPHIKQADKKPVRSLLGYWQECKQHKPWHVHGNTPPRPRLKHNKRQVNLLSLLSQTIFTLAWGLPCSPRKPNYESSKAFHTLWCMCGVITPKPNFGWGVHSTSIGWLK